MCHSRDQHPSVMLKGSTHAHWMISGHLDLWHVKMEVRVKWLCCCLKTRLYTHTPLTFPYLLTQIKALMGCPPQCEGKPVHTHSSVTSMHTTTQTNTACIHLHINLYFQTHALTNALTCKNKICAFQCVSHDSVLYRPDYNP